MKKMKYNSKIAKKVVLYGILALLVFWLGLSIVTSFTDYRHMTTQSSEIESSIPVGGYQDYLKIVTGENPERLREFELSTTKLNALKVTSSDLHNNIIVSGNSGVMTQTDQNLERNWPSSEADISRYSQYLNGDTGILTSETGEVTYTVNVPKAGLYYLKMSYFIPKGNGANVERAVAINGEIPFDSLGTLTLYRLYKDANDIKQDITGNDLKPSQVEIYEYRETYLRDQTGYVTDPYLIHLKSGSNKISFIGIKEKLVITELQICATDTYQLLTYDEYYQKMSTQSGTTKDTISNYCVKYEAEDSSRRFASSPTLYPISDRTSFYNAPNDPVRVKYNAIGGTKWSSVGDTIYWNVDVEEDGFYLVAFRAKQDLSRGMFSTRKLLVDGVQPFSEAANCRFYYNSKYSIVTVGDEKGNGYYVYLEAGSHTLGLQATLGDYGQSLSRVQQVIDDLNNLYLRIIAITTTNPDDYSNYYLYGSNARLANDSLGRDMQTIFSDCAVELNAVSKEITKLTGEKSSLNNVLDKIVLQIGGYVDANGDGVAEDVGGFATKPRNVTKDLPAFKTNLSSLGTWMLDIQQQTLTIESIYIYSSDYSLPRAEANFFQSLWFSVRGFFGSFFFDYQAIGITNEGGFDREIEVWFLTSTDSGREQANVIKSIIDQDFIYDVDEYKDYKCNVILKILAPSVLLPATLAGTGPDVAINVDGGLPVNYALRGAIYNLAEQDDFVEAVLERFTLPSSGITSLRDINVMVPYELEGGYYGLPNTTSFLVMFYRTDIFADNGWEVPTTWMDVINLVTELQISNLDFYLPLEGAGSQIYATILYQMGGQFYTDDHTATDFSSEVAKKAFEQWCSYFSDYSFELAASFTNRFRSGEMPIGISSFTLYNTLAVFAPDIAGKWAFAPLPGYYDNGVLNNKGALSSTASVIMKASKDYDASWAFLKFWTSTETQIKFSQEIESILGSGARHNTANINAMKNLAWSRSELDILIGQFENAFGVPEVPGGYYIGRNLENAIREVINNDSNARETFAEYVEMMNSEIRRKREEFGLPTAK